MQLPEIIAHFNSEIEQGETFVSPARSLTLQREQCDKLEALLARVSQVKAVAISRGIEDHANLFLGYECAIGAILSELRMWVLLKMDKGNAAWDQMVAAQMACLDAVRAHPGFSHVGQVAERLEQIEALVFPKAVYLSAGITSSFLECSICHADYSKCDHLRSRPYMGELCEVYHREIRGDHIAVVKSPADKRCRVISIKTETGHQNKITLITTPYKDGETFDQKGGLEVQGIFMNARRFPYLRKNADVFDEI